MEGAAGCFTADFDADGQADIGLKLVLGIDVALGGSAGLGMQRVVAFLQVSSGLDVNEAGIVADGGDVRRHIFHGQAQGADIADRMLVVHLAVFAVDGPGFGVAAIGVGADDVRPVSGVDAALFAVGDNQVGDGFGKHIAIDVILADEEALTFEPGAVFGIFAFKGLPNDAGHAEFEHLVGGAADVAWGNVTGFGAAIEAVHVVVVPEPDIGGA